VSDKVIVIALDGAVAVGRVLVRLDDDRPGKASHAGMVSVDTAVDYGDLDAITSRVAQRPVRRRLRERQTVDLT